MIRLREERGFRIYDSLMLTIYDQYLPSSICHLVREPNNNQLDRLRNQCFRRALACSHGSGRTRSGERYALFPRSSTTSRFAVRDHLGYIIEPF